MARDSCFALPSGLISGLNRRTFRPLDDPTPSGSNRTTLHLSTLSNSVLKSLLHFEMYFVSSTRAAARGIFFWKNARSSCLIARLTGGRNMAARSFSIGLKILGRKCAELLDHPIIEISLEGWRWQMLRVRLSGYAALRHPMKIGPRRPKVFQPRYLTQRSGSWLGYSWSEIPSSITRVVKCEISVISLISLI